MSTRTPTIRQHRPVHRYPTTQLDIDRLDFRNALVIEESITLRGMLVEFLKKRGWIVRGVKRVDQALPFLKCLPHRLIVVDSNLSAPSAINFARTLHNSQEWSTTPLLLITDSTSEISATDRNTAGIESVRRSVWKADFTNILARLEGHRRQKRQLYAT